MFEKVTEEKNAMDRPDYEHRRRIWPVPLKPLPDELLSSWMIRLSAAHGLTFSNFCMIVWPKEKVGLLNVDIFPETRILETLANRTGVPMVKVQATTFAEYEGRLFTASLPGQHRWILYRGSITKVEATHFGQQYCADCLLEDEEPYFRRQWCLALVVFCLRHSLQLRDRCHECEQPVRFLRSVVNDERQRLSGMVTTCWSCRADLRQMPKSLRLPATPAELEYQRFLLEALQQGWVEIKGEGPVFSYLYFEGLYHVLVLLLRPVSGRRRSLQQQALEYYGLSAPELALPERLTASTFMRLGVTERRQLLNLASRLLADWPTAFLAFCRANNLGYSGVTSFKRSLPYWFYRVVDEHLSCARYRYTDQELESLIDYLRRKNGHAPTRQEVLPYLSEGVRQHRFGKWGLLRMMGNERECPYCQEATIHQKSGFLATNGKQRWMCMRCRRTYVLNATRIVHSQEERSEAAQLYFKGHRVTDIARKFAVSPRAVRKWVHAHRTSESQSG